MPNPPVRRRTRDESGTKDREMAQAGVRFERYVRDAMTEGELSLADLARESGVKETNWHGWFRGEHQPRRNSLVLAARALSRTPDQLLAVWEGDRPRKRRGATETPDELVSALLRQSAAIEASRKALMVVLVPPDATSRFLTNG